MQSQKYSVLIATVKPERCVFTDNSIERINIPYVVFISVLYGDKCTASGIPDM